MQLALELWLKKNPLHTWHDLVKIMLSLNEGKLAETMCTMLVLKFSVNENDHSIPVTCTTEHIQVQPSPDPLWSTLDHALKKQIEIFQERFGVLREAACKDMEERGVHISDVRRAMISLPMHSAYEHQKYIQDNYPFFKRVDTIEELFSRLNFYLSFINFSLLEHIINRCGSNPLKQMMRAYAGDMELFRKETVIKDIVPYLPKRSNFLEGYATITLTTNININEASLEDLEEYRKRCACEFRLSDLILYFASAQPGSLVIGFLVPSSVVLQLKQHLKNYSGIFSRLHIFKLSIDGEGVSAAKLKLETGSYMCASTASLGGEYEIPMQEMINTSISNMKYFDIMIIGHTGLGKTTTADKLLIANPEGIDYSCVYRTNDSHASSMDIETIAATVENLSMWFIQNTNQTSFGHIATRLKNLVFYRCLENPHIEINTAHENQMRVASRTLQCELFSNETTRVRVLDVPGFFGPIESNASHIEQGINAAHIRNILHAQTIMKTNFNRILYFLPCRGPLSGINVLHQELQLLMYHFGRFIFDSIVLVATLDSKALYDVKLTQSELESSRSCFQEALKQFIPEDVPNPPIIFISLLDTCESILEKVKAVQVKQDCFQVQLNALVCSKCGITIGEKDGERIACTYGEDWLNAVLYEHSHCHPMFVPRYTAIQKIAAAVTSFFSRNQSSHQDYSEVKCIQCQQPPGTKGCMRVGETFVYEGNKSAVVDHNVNLLAMGDSTSHRMINQELVPSVSQEDDDSYEAPKTESEGIPVIYKNLN